MRLLAVDVSQCIGAFPEPRVVWMTSVTVFLVVSACFSRLLGIQRLCNRPVFRGQFHRLEVARRAFAPYKETHNDFLGLLKSVCVTVEMPPGARCCPSTVTLCRVLLAAGCGRLRGSALV